MGHIKATFLTTGVQCPGSSRHRVLDAHDLSLILKHSHTKRDAQNIVDQNLEGARACCAPNLDLPLLK